MFHVRGSGRRGRVGVRAVGLATMVMLATATSTAQAQVFAEVEFWVGSGANQAGFVIDWNDGKEPASLMWGYRWDGDATGEQMLAAIVAADPRLYAHVSTAFGGGLGTALYGVGYDLDDDGVFGVSPAASFDSVGYSVGAPVDGRVPTDAGDHWQEGWMSDGFWSYWVSEPASTPAWGFSGLGMSSRALVDGSWDGWSYAPGFDGAAPSTPRPATVAAPSAAALLGFGAVLAGRRRRRTMLRVLPIAVPAVAVMTSVSSASAQYKYDPTDFAVEVVSSVGLPGTSLYNDPAAVLGRPATWFNNSFNQIPDYRRVKIVEPAFNRGREGEKLITTLNEGQSITVRIGRRVYDDPQNPFGMDLNVFGNSFFAGRGGFVSDQTDLNTYTLSNGVFAEDVRVSVSPDNVNWYTFEGLTGDGRMPTNSFRWDRASASWTDIELDPTMPVDPALYSLNFDGLSAADALDLYGSSAGGTGFDLAVTGFEWIEYVRVDGVAGFAGGEIDAIAAVNPIPTMSTVAIIGLGLAGRGGRRRR